MDFRDRRGLRQCAASALENANYNPKKLMLIYAGISLAASLIVMCISYLLDGLIANTSGLGGIGQRSLLSTLQLCLELALYVVLPVWQFGILAVTLRLVRGSTVSPPTLLIGFYNFWPILRLTLLQGLMIFGLTFAATYLGSILFLFTPLSTPLIDAMNNAPEITEELITAIAGQFIIPMLGCMLLVAGIVLIPFLYKLRLSYYLLLDSQENRALQAIRISKGLMRGKRLTLFKLDLSFWWYHLLIGLTSTVCFGYELLASMGVTLPMPGYLAAILFAAVGYALQLWVIYWKGVEVQTTYAAFYQAVIQPPLVHVDEA